MSDTSSQRAEHIAAVVTYLTLKPQGRHHGALREELSALLPDAPMTHEVTEQLLGLGCPDMLRTYIERDPREFDDTLGATCPLTMLMPAPGGRDDTLRAIDVIAPFVFGDRQGIADASLRLAVAFDDPQLITDIAKQLECPFTSPGVSFNRFAAWLSPVPAMRAWIASQMAHADTTSNDWRLFINRALETMHPTPIALLIKSGINPRKICPDQAYTQEDWFFPVWHHLASAHHALTMPSRLPSFEVICDTPSNEVAAMLIACTPDAPQP